MDLHAEILQAKIRLHNLIYTDWITTDLFSIRWYGTVVFILFSYALCFWLLDKRRFTQILLFGSLMTVMVSLFDTFGTNFILWSYLTRIFPIVPSLFLYDFTIVPLYYMLVYQYSPDWKAFAFWNAAAAGIISFAIYPLLTALDMFALHNWRYAYFFPFIFTFGLIGRAVVLGVMAIEENRRQGYAPHYASNLTLQPAMKPLTDKKEKQNKD
jgi:MFS family permease